MIFQVFYYHFVIYFLQLLMSLSSFDFVNSHVNSYFILFLTYTCGPLFKPRTTGTLPLAPGLPPTNIHGFNSNLGTTSNGQQRARGATGNRGNVSGVIDPLDPAASGYRERFGRNEERKATRKACESERERENEAEDEDGGMAEAAESKEQHASTAMTRVTSVDADEGKYSTAVEEQIDEDVDASEEEEEDERQHTVPTENKHARVELNVIQSTAPLPQQPKIETKVIKPSALSGALAMYCSDEEGDEDEDDTVGDARDAAHSTESSRNNVHSHVSLLETPALPPPAPVNISEIMRRRMLLPEDAVAPMGPAVVPPASIVARPPIVPDSPAAAAPAYSNIAPSAKDSGSSSHVLGVIAPVPSVPMPASMVIAHTQGPKLAKMDKELTAFRPAALMVRRGDKSTSTTTSSAKRYPEVTRDASSAEQSVNKQESVAIDDIYSNFMNEISNLGGVP